MAGCNVRGIRLGTLDGYFYPIRRGDGEIALDNRSGEIIQLQELVGFAVVKIRLPIPRGMAARTSRAKDKELGIWCPGCLLDIPAVGLGC